MYGNDIKPRTAGRGPRSRMCYICGQQTLLAGYDWHVSKCKDLFIKREALKPKRERRPVPQDPMVSFQATGQAGGPMRQEFLDAYNEHAEQAFQATLAQCRYCGRTFHPDKLRIHNRSCTAEHPAKSVKRNGNDARPTPGHRTIATPGAGASSGLPDISSRPDSNHGAKTTNGIFAKPVKQKSLNNVRFKEEVAETSKPIRPNPVDYDSFKEFEQSIVPAAMITCPDCGRHFNEKAYSHHAAACKKVFGNQRKPFDSRKHRIGGTDMETLNPKKPGGSKSGFKKPGSTRNLTSTMGEDKMPKSKGSNWKDQSSAFRDAIRAARQVSIAERHAQEAGVPLASVLPPPTVRSPDDPVYADYVQCPHCQRKFNQTAGARHIPQCKNIFAKPSRLKKGSGHMAVAVRR